MVYTENQHNLTRKMSFSYYEMSPEPDICFRVVGGKSRFSGILVHFLENSIDFVVGKHTEITVNNPIELSLCMESEAECVMNPFFLGNVFPPRKLDLISISINLW